PAPPIGRPTPWRFTTAAGMMAHRPGYVTGSGIRQAFAATPPLRNVQRGGGTRVEAGPAPHFVAAALGPPPAAASLHPRAAPAPRAPTKPRPAMAMAPHAAAGPSPGQSPFGANRSVAGHGQAFASQQPYRAPAWSAPSTQAWRSPAYNTAPAYRPPTSSAP